MDKQTLSNYGWITVCILVLSVMIALATPFGKFISDGFKATYTGLNDVSNKALASVALGGSGSGGNGGEQGGIDETTPCTHTNLSYVGNGNRTHNAICSSCSAIVESGLSCKATTYISKGEGIYKHSSICGDCSAVISENIVCADNNSDGFCDKCGDVACSHPETTLKSITSNGVKYHTLRCNECNSSVGSREACADADSDSACDVCGATIEASGSSGTTSCAHKNLIYTSNGNKTHTSTCKDCSTVVKTNAKCDSSSCVSMGNGKHSVSCSLCSTKTGSQFCADNTGDNLCDKCGVCAHNNATYVGNGDGTHTTTCPDCSAIVSKPCKDSDSDTLCDTCGAIVG